MQVNVTVQLDPGEVLTVEPDAAAEAVLLALGADLEGDHCMLSVTSIPQTATAGPPPPAPPMPSAMPAPTPYTAPPDPLPELTERQLPAPEEPVTSE